MEGQVWEVLVSIEPKDGIRDPEGESIARYLFHASGRGHVRRVRVGKLLRVEVVARSREEAVEVVRRACDELRLYNPAAHTCRIWSEVRA
ncbi:MAG: phosphoribosylformylglycinamidine synthase subunit PurS [Nitrososphaerota archaeon]